MFISGLYHAKAIKKLKVDMVDTNLILEVHQETILNIDQQVQETKDNTQVAANAVANLDNRLETLEKLAGILYHKQQEQEERINTLETRATSEDLKEFTTSIKSDAN